MARLKHRQDLRETALLILRRAERSVERGEVLLAVEAWLDGVPIQPSELLRLASQAEVMASRSLTDKLNDAANGYSALGDVLLAVYLSERGYHDVAVTIAEEAHEMVGDKRSA